VDVENSCGLRLAPRIVLSLLGRGVGASKDYTLSDTCAIEPRCRAYSEESRVALLSHTEVVASLGDHRAVDLPKSIADIDELEGIGDDFILVLGCDILQRRDKSVQENI
jgi:hypothetical protein